MFVNITNKEKNADNDPILITAVNKNNDCPSYINAILSIFVMPGIKSQRMVRYVSGHFTVGGGLSDFAIHYITRHVSTICAILASVSGVRCSCMYILRNQHKILKKSNENHPTIPLSYWKMVYVVINTCKYAYRKHN